MTGTASTRLGREVNRRQIMIGAAGLTFAVTTGMVPVSRLMSDAQAAAATTKRRPAGSDVMESPPRNAPDAREPRPLKHEGLPRPHGSAPQLRPRP